MDTIIVQQGNPVLRAVAREVAMDLVGGKTIENDILAMRQALRREYDGVAIAAPQIGISKRIFVVSSRVFEHDTQEGDLVCINPVITKTSRKKVLLDEGCLSVRDMYGKVSRHTNVTIQYINQQGQSVVRGAGGLLAHIFQHEIDHLDGILFIDKASGCEKISGKDKEILDQQRANHIRAINNNKKVFILYSGRGSNARNLVDHIGQDDFPADVCGIVKGNYKNHEDHLLEQIQKVDTDIICLAGYMHILSDWFLSRVDAQVLNIHPSYLPKYKGLDTHARAIRNKETETGCTVHVVTKDLDSGRIIQQTPVGIDKSDTPESLAAKVLRAEHLLYPEALRKFINELNNDPPSKTNQTP